MAQHEYRLTVYKTTNENTVDFYATEIAQLPDSFGAQRINLLEGRTESLNWTLRLNETQAFGGGAWGITDQLADADGRADLLQRRAVLQRRIGGSTGTWTNVAGGRIVNMSQAEDMTWSVEVGDERWIERNTVTFTKGGTVSVWPPGIASSTVYLPQGTNPKIEGYTISPTSTSPRGPVPFTFTPAVHAHNKVQQTLDGDLKPGLLWAGYADSTDGAYKTLRLHVEGTTHAYKITQRIVIPEVQNDAGEKVTQFQGVRALQSTAHPLPVGSSNATECWLYMPNAAATKRLPLHIGRSFGNGPMHPFQFLKNLYDGEYQRAVDPDSDQAVAVQTVRYSTGAMAALIDNPDVFPQYIFPRITKTMTVAEAAEQYVFRPCGYVPVVSNDGSLKPVRARLPTGDDVPSTTALFEFNETNASMVPTWDHGIRDRVTSVRVEHTRRWYVPTFDGGNGAGGMEGSDNYAEEDAEPYLQQSDRLRAGTAVRREHTVWLPDFWFNNYIFDGAYGETYAADVFARYGDGPQYARLRALSAASTVEVGDIVVVNIDTFPNTFNRQLGGRVLMQVTSRAVTPAGYSFDLIHVGPDLQPLGTPSVTLSRSTSDPYHTIEVVSAGGTTADTVEIQFARSSTAPNASQWRTVATARPSQTVEVGDLMSGTKYYGRGRLMRPNRIKSVWSVSDSTSTQTLPAPSALASTDYGTNWAELTWTVGTTAEDTQVHNSTQGVIARVPEGSDRYLVTGMVQDYNYVFRVRHADDFGGVSPWSTACTVTPSTSGSGVLGLSRPHFLEIALGADSLVSRVS